MRILERCLDNDQLALARIVDRNVLVLAPPGSGKTRLLTHAAAHRVRSMLSPARVMCLTFNVEATHEMRRRLSVPELQCPSNRVLVCNYHQLGMHLLRRWGHKLGGPRLRGLCVDAERDRVLEEVISDFKLPLNVYNAGQAIERLKGQRKDETGLPAETLLRMLEAYDQKLRDRNLRDFVDLIVDATALLSNNPRLQQILHSAYPYIFVDEMQDTSRLQLDLIGTLIGHSSRLFGVADDDQMIYAWLSALPGNLDEFVSRFTAEEHSLVGNYRCPPVIVDLANSVISQNARRRAVLMESRVTGRTGEVRVRIGNGELGEARLIAGEVAAAISDGFSPRKIAILAPHRFKFPPVVDALTDLDIRHVSIGAAKSNKDPIARLVRVLCQGLGAAAGTNSVQLSDLKGVIKNANVRHLERIHAAVEAARREAGVGILNPLLSSFGLGTVRAPSRYQDEIRVLGRMFNKAISDNPGIDAAAIGSVVLGEWQRLEAHALRAEEAVHLMTSYGAKGLEYDVIMLPFLNHGLVPYSKSNIDWQEARRLFYVAITRAAHRVVLSRDSGRSPSHLWNGLAV
jgi:superfamily I DNA/RNA helicase